MFTVPATRLATESQPILRSAVSAALNQLVYKGGFFLASAAFAVGNWTLTNPATAGDLLVTISSLPTSFGTITDIEYRLDGGAWVSSGGTGTFTISGLTDNVSYDVELRAISDFGASAAGDLKSATPTAV
jgi:hypothetical protein